MLNLRKTKKLEILGNDDQMSYGTKKDPKKDIKKDQKKYEEKVDQFLRYCKNFRDELVERSKNKDKEKGLKTVEDIKKCFDSSFKEYYKKSKKFGLFSRTTKVLKGMDKKLDKIKEVELSENVAQKIKDAFKYTSKRDYEKDYGKRSAIDDKAVYGFFNATLPKTIEIICKKQEGELKGEQKFMAFVKEALEEINELSKKADKIENNIKSVQKAAGKQEESIEQLEEAKNKMDQPISKSNDKGIQEASDQIDNGINEVQESAEEISENIEKLAYTHDEVSKKIERLNILMNKFESETLTEKEKSELGKLLGVENLVDITKEKIAAELEKLNEKLTEINNGVANSQRDLADNGNSIEDLDQSLDDLSDDIEEEKKAEKSLFKLENGTLTINGDKGVKSYWEAYKKGCDYNKTPCNEYIAKVKNIVMNNVSDIYDKFYGNKNSYGYRYENGIFNGFAELVSVIGKSLSEKIGDYAFNRCEKLDSFNKGNNYDYNISESVKEICKYAFYKAGTKVSNGFSANVEAKTISSRAFSESGLAKINLPNVTTIEFYAFSGCEKLKEIILGPNITASNIKDSAFAGCINISQVTITKGERQDGAINEIKDKICAQTKKHEKTEKNPNGIKFIIQ